MLFASSLINYISAIMLSEAYAFDDVGPYRRSHLGRVHIAIVVPEHYRYVGSAVYVNALCRQ